LSLLLIIPIVFLHLDVYLFCQQSFKKGEIVGAIMLPYSFEDC